MNAWLRLGGPHHQVLNPGRQAQAWQDVLRAGRHGVRGGVNHGRRLRTADGRAVRAAPGTPAAGGQRDRRRPALVDGRRAGAAGHVSPPGEHDDAFCGRVLVPWPNRVRDGRYAFDGSEQRLELTEPELGNALHGLVLQSRWHGVRTSARRVSLSYDAGPEPGYPFALALSVSYELASGGIVMTLHATNVGTARAPFGAGLHPYLTPGTAHGRRRGARGPRRHARARRRAPAALRLGRRRSTGPSSTSAAPGASARCAWTPASATSAAARPASPASGSAPPRARASSPSGWTSASASSRSSPRTPPSPRADDVRSRRVQLGRGAGRSRARSLVHRPLRPDRGRLLMAMAMHSSTHPRRSHDKVPPLA